MNIPAADLKQIVKRLASSKAENLFLDTDAGRFIAQDPEITVVVQSDKVKSGEGVYSFNARKFTTVVNRMSGEIELGLGKTLTLKSAKAKVEIELLNGKPPVVGVPKPVINLPLPEIKGLLQYAMTAADTNKAAEFGGVIQLSTVVRGFEVEEVVGFKAAGTDGKRLGFAEVESPCSVAPFMYLIPLPAVAALEKLDGKILTAAQSESHFYFADGNTHIFARKLSKAFPNYGSVVPKTFKFVATVQTEELKAALRTVEPFVPDEGARAITVHFLDGTLTVNAKSGGTAQDELAYKQSTPDPIFDDVDFTTRMNFMHLSGFANTASGEIKIQCNEDKDPVLLESGNKKLMAAAVTGG